MVNLKRKTETAMNNYFDLGHYSRNISNNEQCQTWFDRGMVWLFAYNHEEAIFCFEKAIKSDHGCAFAYWGIAYAVGPNYNKHWEVFTPSEKGPTLQKAHEFIQAGQALPYLTNLEKKLLEALVQRYPQNPDIEDFQPFSDAFACAMKPIYEAYSDDLDICCIYVEALMNRTPWRLWNFWKGIPNPKSSTLEAMTILETVFDRFPLAWKHAGLLHMYIHLMEMSPHPEKALRHGDILTTLVPEAGHLVHMATHIDVLCGDYQNVLSRNLLAYKVDNKFKKYAGADNFYALYRIHNLHFAMYGAMFLGHKAAALSAISLLQKEVPDEVVRLYPDIFETFVAASPHVYIRFGMWHEIIELKQPDDKDLYVTTNALIYYAKAIAYANLGKNNDAVLCMAKFSDAYAQVPDSRHLFNNKSRDVLEIANEMMKGEVAFKTGDRVEGLNFLRNAVKLDDSLNYEEPWSWPQPTRHVLGALLLEAGEFEEAESLYKADLGLDGKLPRPSQHPKNVWALHGLHECLTNRNDTIELPHIASLLQQAQARSDIHIKASCMCRSL